MTTHTDESNNLARCELCGEPMQSGEEMFKYHGSLGPCPKPPLPKPKLASLVEFFFRDSGNQFWIDAKIDRTLQQSIAFDSAEERQRAHDDLLNTMRSTGAKDLPNVQQ